MERVVVTPEAPGLGEMIAGIISSNLARDPRRAGLLDGMHGRVNVTATDAGVTTGLLFTGVAVSVGSPLDRPDLAIETDSETLLDLTTVPLRFGSPDVLTPQGRSLLMKMRTGALRVRGIAQHPVLLNKLQRLLSVA